MTSKKQQNKNHQQNRCSPKKSKPQKEALLLETNSVSGMRNMKKGYEEYVQFHWKLYSELAYQRELIIDDITLALNHSTDSDYKFENWQRVVKYKYCLTPFCTVGSTHYIGSRFNIGTLRHELVQFPAFYLAEDYETAKQESFQPSTNQTELDNIDFSLANDESIVKFSFSGALDKILDLRDHKSLDAFVELTQKFQISKETMTKARKLKDDISVVTNSQKLLASILDPDWRRLPSNFDVPSNSQILGHLVRHSGIEGILYPSKYTPKNCLAIFPSCFKNTQSFVKLNGKAPAREIPTVLDGKNWQISENEPGDFRPKN